MNETDLRLMRAAIAVARRSRDRGDHPFGAVLADNEGHVLLEAGNTVVTSVDCTGHAETNLMRKASREYPPDYLATCTLYTSTEPCPMCTAAIFWGGVGRIVYGLGQEDLYAMVKEDSEDVLLLPCRDLLARGAKAIDVIGPVLEIEARRVHEGFWR